MTRIPSQRPAIARTSQLSGDDGRAGYGRAALLFVVGALALAFPWLSGRVTIPWDAKAEFYPQLVFLARSIHSGEWPFWAPNVFGGQPQIADPQSLIFSPPFLLLALFNPSPGFQAADAAVFATLICGGLGVMMFCRDRGWHPVGGLVAAFVFSFGASNAWRIQHIGQVMSLCWFAIALWLLARAMARRSVLWGLLAGLAAGFLLIGRDQVAGLCALILAAFALVQTLERPRGPRDLLAKSIPLSVAAASAVLTALVPILLTAVFAAQSNRPLIAYDDAVAASLHPAAFFTLISADLFGVAGPMSRYWGPPTPEIWGDRLALARNMATIYAGALPVVAIFAVGLVRGRLFDREVRFFTMAAALAALYALGKYTPFFQFAYNLPGADMFRRPADATFPLGAMLAFVAGYLVHRLIDAEERLSSRRWIVSCALVCAALLSCVWIAWSKDRLLQSAAALLIAAAAFAAASFTLWAMRAFWSRQNLLLVLATIVMVADLAVGNGPNESTALRPTEYEMLRPDTSNETVLRLFDLLQKSAAPDRRDRVDLSAVGFAWPDAALIHGFDHWLGYNPLVLGWYAKATGAIDHVAIPEQRKFSPLFDSYHSPMLNLLGVRILATGVPLAELDRNYRPGAFAEIGRTKDAHFYENPHALPRVLVATQARQANFDRMIREGGWPDVDFRRTVLLENAGAALAAPPPSAQTRARLLSYGNTRVRVEAVAEAPGWLVLHDTWHPWWRADIDGRPVEVLRANVIFRAVAIPAGRSVVTFHFDPLGGLARALAR